MSKSRKNKVWAAGVVVVLLAAGSAWHLGHRPEDQDGEVLQGTTPIATRDGEVLSLASDTASHSLTRSQAAVIFADKRVQFDNDCRVTPKTLAARSGEPLMFDNRSRDAITFKLDDTTYVIPGYGFKILQLAAATLPHVADVDCGPGQGSGTIILQ